MDGFQRRRERKKESIRRAALELYSKYGVQKVRVAEIAKKAKVSQVTIYNYFGGKNELLRDVISRLLNEKLQEHIELVETDLPFPEKIEKFISEKTRDLAALNPDFLKSIMSEDPAIKEMVEDFAKYRFIPLMLNFIEKGKNDGYINKSISTEAILLYINIFKEAKRSDMLLDQEQNQRLFKELATLFYYGLLGKPRE
ncbi:MAG: TetR/AcrR family transcriptional regulator [Candidatus Desulforudis sp.]|nr:TetR/AcrR family transcriptional regulator [Desulforudis sp.]